MTGGSAVRTGPESEGSRHLSANAGTRSRACKAAYSMMRREHPPGLALYGECNLNEEGNRTIGGLPGFMARLKTGGYGDGSKA